MSRITCFDVGLPKDDISAQLMGCSFRIEDTDRYSVLQKMRKTMQGAVYKVRDQNDGRTYVLKRASRKLVTAGISWKKSAVAENVVDEIWTNAHLEIAQRKLLYREKGLTRFIGWWLDHDFVNIVTEYNGGKELFEYVTESEALARDVEMAETLPLSRQKPHATGSAWIRHVQTQFRTLVSATHFMHCNNVVHMDLSLENVMVSGKRAFEREQLKIIDLGLARHFPKGDFRTFRRCGKMGYMPPEMHLEKRYDARSADIWCMGVMLFLMLVRVPPFGSAAATDPVFQHIVDGNLDLLLERYWERMALVTDDALDLLNKMLKYETERITMEELLAHPFVAVRVDDSSKATASGESTEDLAICVTPTSECSSEWSTPALLPSPIPTDISPRPSLTPSLTQSLTSKIEFDAASEECTRAGH